MGFLLFCRFFFLSFKKIKSDPKAASLLFCQPERVPGIFYVRPDTSDTAKTILLPKLANILF